MTDRVLITGATGYVGGRLRRRLEEAGVPLTCLARRAPHLASRVESSTRVVEGDVLQPATLPPALHDVDVAYYLVHSMGSDRDFEAADREGAENFARAARAAGVRRIVYLGGLGGDDSTLSPHLRSRQEVGRVLREHHPEVVEFRASIVIGSGSLSFELVRALVERLPVMITPTWTTVLAQPIAIRDLLAYLLAARHLPTTGHRTYEIGGADQVSYEGMMREYARQRGLRRWFVRIPVITPWLSSLWLGLVTPVFARIGRKLIESIRHPTVVRDPQALRDFAVVPVGVATAIARALESEERRFVESRWYDALSSGGALRSFAGVRFGNRIADRRSVLLAVDARAAFAPIRRIGGKSGWYACDLLWRIRGAIDVLLGGVGLRRGRFDEEELHVGDALDFWRVEALVPDRLLRLSAEMRLPGRAWLEFEVIPEGEGVRICQTALFDPVGLAGLAYWYLIYPLHALVFRRMLRAIAERALAEFRAAAGAGRS